MRRSASRRWQRFSRGCRDLQCAAARSARNAPCSPHCLASAATLRANDDCRSKPVRGGNRIPCMRPRADMRRGSNGLAVPASDCVASSDTAASDEQPVFTDAAPLPIRSGRRIARSMTRPSCKRKPPVGRSARRIRSTTTQPTATGEADAVAGAACDESRREPIPMPKRRFGPELEHSVRPRAPAGLNPDATDRHPRRSLRREHRPRRSLRLSIRVRRIRGIELHRASTPLQRRRSGADAEHDRQDRLEHQRRGKARRQSAVRLQHRQWSCLRVAAMAVDHLHLEGLGLVSQAAVLRRSAIGALRPFGRDRSSSRCCRRPISSSPCRCCPTTWASIRRRNANTRWATTGPAIVLPTCSIRFRSAFAERCWKPARSAARSRSSRNVGVQPLGCRPHAEA